MKIRDIAVSTIVLVTGLGAASAETVYLTADRMIEPGSGRVTEAAAVVIADGVITAAGRAADITAPAGARTIDLGGKTILPGLIDMHTHLSGDATKGGGYSFLAYPPERSVDAGCDSRLDGNVRGRATFWCRRAPDAPNIVMPVPDAVHLSFTTCPK